ncbi:SYT1 [Symbiodinium necroappetens]|uniref:SYT1 protein n=1 Tax=Symbiodinium necroappetens TaxID=1628268 RepID=A0A812MQ08_9DINO|nr:SYT1 [Symbiodinium necroappetens]
MLVDARRVVETKIVGSPTTVLVRFRARALRGGGRVLRQEDVRPPPDVAGFAAAIALDALEDVQRLETQITADESRRLTTSDVGPLEIYSYIDESLGLLIDTALAAVRHAVAATAGSEPNAVLVSEASLLERQLNNMLGAQSKEPLFFWHGPKRYVSAQLQRVFGRGPWHEKLKELAASASPSLSALVGKVGQDTPRSPLQGRLPEVGLAVDDGYCSKGDDNSGVAPYAVLHLRIDRAFGLPAADFTGLSDPYVKAQLNDHDLPEVRTKTRTQTLAPKWEEEFHIRIFRPGSVLSVYVHDEDFGEASKIGLAGAFMGLSDDLLGYVDISIERLPLNTKVCGWFNLWDPNDHKHRLLNYKSRAANLEQGIRPQTVGRIRLQLTLHVAQLQHELFAHCLGPPAFEEPQHPLRFAKLFGDVSTISHLIQDFSSRCSPLAQQAERFSSLLWCTVILLVWRPEFILPLLSLSSSAMLYAAGGPAEAHAPTGNEEQDSSDEDLATTEKEPKKVEEETVDPALQKVFAAAETSLPPEQYSDFSTVQTNLDQVVVMARSFEALKAMVLLYRLPVCGGLCLLTALLIYLREWQGLLIRLLLTAGCGFLLVDQSCVARIVRAFAAYRTRKKPLREFQPHDVQAASPKTPATRRNTQVLTPNAVAALSNSPANIQSDGKPMQHRLQEGSWTEPKWCQHCGGFLWGVWRQGWQCSHCSIILCHTCATDADLDFCSGEPCGLEADVQALAALSKKEFPRSDGVVHVIMLTMNEASLQRLGSLLGPLKEKLFVSASLPPELFDALDPREASKPGNVAQLMDSYISSLIKATGISIDLIWLPYAAFKKQYWTGTQKMLEKKRSWSYGIRAEVHQASVVQKLLVRNPAPVAWLATDDLLRPVHQDAVEAALQAGIPCVSFPRKEVTSGFAAKYFGAAGLKKEQSVQVAQLHWAWQRGLSATWRGGVLQPAEAQFDMHVLKAAAFSSSHSQAGHEEVPSDSWSVSSPLEAALHNGRLVLQKAEVSPSTGAYKDADASFTPSVSEAVLKGAIHYIILHYMI